MRITTKDVKPLGFKGSGMFDDSKWYQFYFASVPKHRKVYVISALDGTVSHFDLSKDDYEDFESGDLSVVPPGCCCASGNRFTEDFEIDFKGDVDKAFETKKDFLKFLKRLMK